MGVGQIDVIRWGREGARCGPWRGDHHVAYLSPLPDAPLPSAAFVRRCLDRLAGQGFRRVITSALMPSEQRGFLGAGFVVEEDLLLLAHDLRQLPTPVSVPLRRARDADRPAVLTVDHASFPPFWQLDAGGLDEAVGATPRARLRVSTSTAGAVVGYAVTGKAGRRGYVQRLAVDPSHRRQGIGEALVTDGLRWLRRWRVERAVVNTQLDNASAVALYERLGFRREPVGLSVLSAGLNA